MKCIVCGADCKGDTCEDCNDAIRRWLEEEND